MEIKARKTLAREGLTIIAILALIGVFLFLSMWFSEKKNELKEYYTYSLYREWL